ncbi:MAG: ABC transporter permease [Planctomycetaceae bacterium]|nr:ABC transporter permease [Planctomycetaceae bacterium]
MTGEENVIDPQGEPAPTPAGPQLAVIPKSPGFWKEAWRRFRIRKLSMTAFVFVVLLALVAIFSPAIAGTKPIVVKYKGRLYFPAMAYFNASWENPIFTQDKFRKRYPKNLEEKDPESWAIWPLSFNDPYRRVQEEEWPGRPGNPTQVDGKPSSLNWFGTDQRGVDVFAQMVHGSRIALLVGFVSMGIASAIGIIVGALAGYFGGWVDTLLSRVIEVVLCIPTLVLILALLAIIEQVTIWHMMAIIGATRWTSIARLTRAEFLKLKQMDFVSAARATGVGPIRIMFRYLLPNALAPVLVPITFGIASAILIESSLSFLGFGAPPPNPSWGTLLSAGRSNYQLWWLIVFPGTAIFLAVLAYNLIGEGLQEATDPRLRDADG